MNLGGFPHSKFMCLVKLLRHLNTRAQFEFGQGNMSCACAAPVPRPENRTRRTGYVKHRDLLVLRRLVAHVTSVRLAKAALQFRLEQRNWPGGSGFSSGRTNLGSGCGT
ncbi:Protein of unknown function, partial [Cotesia congregata]